jgi:hypothetical protein
MVFRRSRRGKAKEAVTEQVTDRTDDLMAALDAAREALARASTAAGRKGAELADELGKEAGKAADKLLPERARQRRRELARRRRRRLLAGAAGLAGVGLLATRLAGSRGGSRDGVGSADRAGGGWDRTGRSGHDADTMPTAEVTQLHQDNGASTNPARTPPS